jgi:hypothetical protein
MSVGVKLNINHLAATPIGMQVTARPVLSAVDGRWLTLKVEACDEQEKIGDDTPTRAIINLERFMNKAREKVQQSQRQDYLFTFNEFLQDARVHSRTAAPLLTANRTF